MHIKNWLIIGLAAGLLAGLCMTAAAQGPGFLLQGIGSAPVPVTMNKMTNLIFPEAIQTGVKVSRDVLAQKVRGVENVLELKAVRPGFPPTNLSVYGKDGRLYSFLLQYAGDSTVLNFRVVPDVAVGVAGFVMLTGLLADVVTLRLDAMELSGRKPFLHVIARMGGVKLRLAGLFLRDSLEWVVLELSNRWQIPFRPGYVRFFAEDRKQVKRKAVQELAVAPVYNGVPGNVPGRGRVAFAVGFNPFTVPPDKRLVVEMAGADGRTVALAVKSKVLLKARRVGDDRDGAGNAE